MMSSFKTSGDPLGRTCGARFTGGRPLTSDAVAEDGACLRGRVRGQAGARDQAGAGFPGVVSTAPGTLALRPAWSPREAVAHETARASGDSAAGRGLDKTRDRKTEMRRAQDLRLARPGVSWGTGPNPDNRIWGESSLHQTRGFPTHGGGRGRATGCRSFSGRRCEPFGGLLS